MSHWAAELVGVPWRAGAQGPDAFNCWGLVREALRRGWGVEMPLLAIGEPAPGSLRDVARGWRRVPLPVQDGDILQMMGAEGRHAGVIVERRLLHCGRLGVAWERLGDIALRFHDLEAWRRG